MAENRTHSDYLQKAAMYDLLGQFYKYSNPNLYLDYYLRHLKYLRKANDSLRNPGSTATTGEAKVRFVHTSFDAGNIDVYINGVRLVRDFPFSQVSNALTLKAGKYHVDIYPAGNMTDSVLNKRITVEGGQSYTFAAIDKVAKMRLLSFTDRPGVPLNESKVRFIHLSTDMKAIDIAVKNRDVFFPNVSYKQATDYLGLTPMTIDLEAREAGTRNILLPMTNMHFKANETYTVIFTGLVGGQPGLQAVVLID
jgi:hypothetical protein